MALSGAEYSMAVMAAFPLSLVVILSSVPFFIDIDILDFFSKTVPISFLPFLLGGPRICRGQNYPRLCLKTTWTFITRPRLYPSSARALGPNVKMGQDHKFLGPTIIIHIIFLSLFMFLLHTQKMSLLMSLLIVF